ncbi:MAG: S1 RNA-binding domain-containing protein [Chloroflexi bacterium]|nr:MAG: 30S ribosomal protein S1 [Phototrophicales bacterium]RMF80373.1 MAG: S1 RNA-binding domain-containing protein [Chloroflexota bacterium]
MSTNAWQQDSASESETPDEGYWSALLNEGEYSTSLPDDDESTEYESESFDEYTEVGFDREFHVETSPSDWADMRTVMDNDEVLDLTVIGYNRGGLLVQWRTLRGFVPASQLVNFPATANSIARHNALKECVGKVLNLRVIELNIEQNRLIFSERAAQAKPGERADILNRLQPGDIVSGFVTNLCDFGAFVDLGGLEGLIHISELSWGRVEHPADMLERGDEVRAYVLDVNRSEGRIALSLKRLRPDPWQTVDERYHIGQIVKGSITNVVDFGAFACIEEGLEGLIHVSELAEGHFLHPRNVVSEGEEVSARILSIDGKSRRLGLSLRLEDKE